MRILLTGGSACGKSSYAENLAVQCPAPRYYVAAMKPYGCGSRERIDRHRETRKGKGFTTIERYDDPAGLILPERGVVLLECMCNLTANEMFDDVGNVHDPFDGLMRGIKALEAQCDTLIVVTNDVGSGVGVHDPGTMLYIETLGRVNAALAARFDAVYELVCGMPIAIKASSKNPEIKACQ